MCLCFLLVHIALIRQPAHFMIIFLLQRIAEITVIHMQNMMQDDMLKAIHSLLVQQLQQLRHLFLFHAATVRIGLRTAII